jgi:hypothetical protein
MSQHPKRPRDLNQWAKRMTDIVSGEVENHAGPLPGSQMLPVVHWRSGDALGRFHQTHRAACHHNMPLTVIHVTSMIEPASLALHRFRYFDIA